MRAEWLAFSLTLVRAALKLLERSFVFAAPISAALEEEVDAG